MARSYAGYFTSTTVSPPTSGHGSTKTGLENTSVARHRPQPRGVRSRGPDRRQDPHRQRLHLLERCRRQRARPAECRRVPRRHLHRRRRRPNDTVLGVAVQADAKILIAGVFTSYNGAAADFLARLTTTGAFDTTFTGHGTGLDSNLLGVGGPGRRQEAHRRRLHLLQRCRRQPVRGALRLSTPTHAGRGADEGGPRGHASPTKTARSRGGRTPDVSHGLPITVTDQEPRIGVPHLMRTTTKHQPAPGITPRLA